MSTLLIRLAGPMQSWGLSAKFDRRGTERIPTKSGVIGLVAAALGRRRDESIDDLSALRFGVRVESEGILLEDFHIARSTKSAYVTRRSYLSDAIFLIGLEGDEALLHNIAEALEAPAFPLFLGRRSCPPEGRLLLGLRLGITLEQALKKEAWQGSTAKRSQTTQRLQMYVDAQEGQSGYWLRDVPVSFNQAHRRYGFRSVNNLSVLSPSLDEEIEKQTTHDVMRELEA